MGIRIKEITLVNFIGIYNGIGKKKLSLDFKHLLDKDIILILGDNGTGKSTLSSVLHPLPGTTDKRNKFIRKGKEGIKTIRYIRDDDVEIECKLMYSPSKTGHNTKGFVTKISNGEETELNPNGNITSYKEIVLEELGVSDAILKLSSQNDVTKGTVDMTSTERKVNMATFLPEDIWSHYYTIVDKTFRDFKTRTNILVDSIGKMNDEKTIKDMLENITKRINKLVKKRDKCIGRIKEYETRIEIIQKNGNIVKLYNKAEKMHNSIINDIEEIIEKMKDIKNDIGMDEDILSKNRIDEIKETISNRIVESEKVLSVLDSTISRNKMRRNEISSEINGKKAILSDISSDATLDDLKKLRDKYMKEFNRLDKVISKLDTKLSKDDLLIGYDIVKTIRNAIERINDNENVEDTLSFIDNNDCDNKIIDLNNKINKSKEISNELINRLSNLNQNAHLKEILNKRPKECAIDNCPFIENAQKWLYIEKEIEKYTSMSDVADSKLSSLEKELDYWRNIYSVRNDIKNLISYIKSNEPIIKKLPFNDKYYKYEKLLKSIKKCDTLSGCDDFDEFIEILESKDDYNLLKYEKIPSVNNQIKLLETQGKIIESTQNDLKRLISDESRLTEQLQKDIETLEKLEDSINDNKDILLKLNKLYVLKYEYDDKYNECKEHEEDMRTLKNYIKELAEYEDKLRDRKDKLREIEKELTPLTRDREVYKMEQLKLIDYHKELECIDKDMYKIEIIRDALSTKKDGIPVQALGLFMDVVRQNANSLLSSTFNGSLYLEEFIILDNEFSIPYKKNADIGPDISMASSSERSFISLCLTFAIIEQILSKYTIMILDEIDRGFSEHNKYKFIKILGDQIRRTGISQTFMTTHNREYYEGYDLGFILFPGHGLNKYSKKDIIKVYE